MPVIDGISFPATRWERFRDRLSHWWHAPHVPRSPEPDWDPSLFELLVLHSDD